MNDERFEELCNAAIDQRATPDQMQQLEQTVLESPSRRKQYVDAIAVHGMLRLAGSEDLGRPESDGQRWNERSGKGVARLKNETSRARGWKWRRVGLVAAWSASLATGILLLLSMFSASTKQPLGFATIQSTTQCLWEQSDVGTRAGQKIAAGHFRLAQGLASIRFDNGAIIDLEGPSHLEICNADRCVLHNGKLVLTMESDHRGFKVETPFGTATDQGTSFGVSVDDSGEALVEVFDGEVDIDHHVSGMTRRLGKEDTVRLLARTVADESALPSLPPADGEKVIQITTASQGGADAWVQRDHELRKGDEDVLLAKKSSALKQAPYERKIYLRFDLSDVSTEQLDRASLQLNAVPSGMGFASRSPDSKFAVLGITDDSLDGWTIEELTWDDSPGFRDDVAMPKATTTVGTFTIPKGQQSGSFVVQSEALTNLLRNNANGQITLVVICETEANQWQGLVHAFASSRHASLAPPTLRLWINEF